MAAIELRPAAPATRDPGGRQRYLALHEVAFVAGDQLCVRHARAFGLAHARRRGVHPSQAFGVDHPATAHRFVQTDQRAYVRDKCRKNDLGRDHYQRP